MEIVYTGVILSGNSGILASYQSGTASGCRWGPQTFALALVDTCRQIPVSGIFLLVGHAVIYGYDEPYLPMGRAGSIILRIRYELRRTLGVSNPRLDPCGCSF